MTAPLTENHVTTDAGDCISMCPACAGFFGGPRPTEKAIGDHRLKVSGTGWLCVFDRGEWIAVLKLTPTQCQEYKQALIDLRRTPA